MSDNIIVEDDGAVRVVRINRPEKKNALTSDMYVALADALNGANADSAVRCTLVAGVPGAFTAGNDLADFMKAATQGAGLARPAHVFLKALVHNEKPLLAAVQGVAVGVGTTMLLHCDFVAAGTDAKFSTPFVALGLLPEAGSSLLAPRLMGHPRAFSLLVMGRKLDAAQAQACGLVTEVVAPDEVDAHALKAAQDIAALPPEAVALSRKLMRGPTDDIAARIDEEARLFGERLKSPEAHAAFSAFLNRKR